MGLCIMVLEGGKEVGSSGVRSGGERRRLLRPADAGLAMTVPDSPQGLAMTVPDSPQGLAMTVPDSPQGLATTVQQINI